MGNNFIKAFHTYEGQPLLLLKHMMISNAVQICLLRKQHKWILYQYNRFVHVTILFILNHFRGPIWESY